MFYDEKCRSLLILSSEEVIVDTLYCCWEEQLPGKEALPSRVADCLSVFHEKLLERCVGFGCRCLEE